MASRFLAVALGLSLSLVLAELALRTLAPQERSWLDIYEQGRELPFYTQKPDLRETIETGEGLWHIHTDANGNRIARVASPAAAGPEVLVLGDSFTFGQGAEYEDSFPGLLAKRLEPNYRLVNAGVGGYGPVQYRMILENALSAGRRPALVLVVIYVGNDFLDCLGSKRLTVIDGAIVTSNNRFRAALKQNLHLYRLLSKVYQRFAPADLAAAQLAEPLYSERSWQAGRLQEAYAVFGSELERISTLARESGTPLLVAIIPTAAAVSSPSPPSPAAGDSVDYRLPIEKARLVLAASRARTIDLTEPLRAVGAERAYFAHDGHLTPAGNAAVAAALWDPVRELSSAP